MYLQNPKCWQILFLLRFLTPTVGLISSLRCKALDIVINFLVLWFICLNFSRVHFKNCPKYLRRKAAQMFIALMRFQMQNLVYYYYNHYHYYYFTLFRVFHTSIIIIIIIIISPSFISSFASKIFLFCFYYYFTPCEFFSIMLADGFPLEF